MKILTQICGFWFTNFLLLKGINENFDILRIYYDIFSLEKENYDTLMELF